MRENLGMEYHKLQCEKTSICTYSRCSEKSNTGKSRYCVSHSNTVQTNIFRIGSDLRSTTFGLPLPTSRSPFLYRIYLSPNRYTESHIEIFSYRTWPPLYHCISELSPFRHRNFLSYTEFTYRHIEILYPIPSFSRIALDLRFTISGIPFPTLRSLSSTEFTFRCINILNPIPIFSRIVLDLRFTISAIPFPASRFPFLYRIYLSLYHANSF